MALAELEVDGCRNGGGGFQMPFAYFLKLVRVVGCSKSAVDRLRRFGSEPISGRWSGMVCDREALVPRNKNADRPTSLGEVGGSTRENIPDVVSEGRLVSTQGFH